MRKSITKEELTQLQQQNIVVTIIDIRSPEEYEKQHIPSTINIPSEELQNKAGSFSNADKIICVCNHGRERSQQAAEMLYNSGFENTYYLRGGVAGWFVHENEQANNEISTGPSY